MIWASGVGDLICRELTVGSVQTWHVNPSPEDGSDPLLQL